MSRNGNGDYTLPLNDVETGTTISSVWANTTMEDIATALTNSLSRNANGGMNAPLRHSDGTVNAPSLSFNTETNTGIYRVTTGEYRFCVNGKDKLRVIDVDGMPAVQVYSNIAPIGWQTLGTASDIAGLTLQKVLQQGDRSLGENIVMGSGSAGPTSYLSTIAFDGVDSASAKAHMWYENNALRVLSGENLEFTTDTAGVNSNILINSAGFVNIEHTNGFTVTNPSNGVNLGVTAGFSTIVISPGSTASPTPQALFTESANIQLLTSVDVTGTVTPQAIDLGVDQKLKFSSDVNNYLQIYRGSNGTSYIQEVGSGALHIRGEVTTIRNDADQVMLAADSGTVSLWAFGVQRFQTGGAGINVTGVVDCDAVRLGNDQKITFGGTGAPNLEMYETAGGTGLIVQNGAGDLVIKGQIGSLQNDSGNSLLQWDADDVALYWRGANFGQRLLTTETGIDVTGTVDLDNLTISADQGTVGQVLTSTGSGIEWAAGGAGGEETLAQTLAFGNTTGGTDLAITTGDAITSPTDANLVIQGTGQTENYVQFGAGGQLEVSFDGGGSQITENDVGVSPLAIQGREVQINLTYESPRMGTGKPVLAGSTSTVLLFNDADMNVANFGNDGLDWCWFSSGANRANAKILSATTDGTTATITLAKPLSGNNVPVAGDLATCGGRELRKRFSAGGSTNTFTDECGLYSGSVAVDDEDAYSLQTRAGTGITLGGVVNTGNATIGTDANPDVINIKRGEALDSGQETQIKGGLQSDKLVKLQNADILNNNLTLEYGKRIINTATTVTTYAIPSAGTGTFAGNSVVICNPTSKTITLDADGGTGTIAQYVWILDGVTLIARNGDWQIKAGGVIELVQVGTDTAGGSQSAPNYVIFGAGILAI